MNVAAFIVAAINVPQIIECSSPESATFDIFLSFSHLIFYFIHKFCCVTSHDESFGICLSLAISTIRLPRSIMNHLSVPYGMRSSVEKSVSMMRTNLLHCIPRSFIRFLRWAPHRLITVRLLRRIPGRTPFHPCAVLPRPASRTHPLPATPFQCPRSRTATLG